MTLTVVPKTTAQERAEGPPTLDLVLPVYNEAHVLAVSVERLVAFLDTSFPFTWQLTIVDNASTDGTWAEACRLVEAWPGVRALHLDAKGRGRALRAAWSVSTAEVLAYMDVDLSTDLAGLLPLVAPLLSGHSDIVIGSRLLKGASVRRGAKRETVSRAYNRILHVVFHNGFRDAQCGFKAIRADRARVLLPHVHDEAWFFDTELLLVAERSGMRITEVAVDWVDDPDSRVRIVRTAWDDLVGVARLRRLFWAGGGRVAPLPARQELRCVPRRLDATDPSAA